MITHNIGIYLTDKKKRELLTQEVILYCKWQASLNDIMINFVDLKETEGQDNYKDNYYKIISKLDEFYADGTISNNIVNYLITVDEQNIIDPVKCQYDVGNRLIMAEKLDTICKRFKNLFVPQYFYIDLNNINKFLPLTYEWPVICKPVSCFGNNFSHDMILVKKNIDIRSLITRPTLVQRFYEHDAIIFKVYVIGKNYEIVIKNSVSIETPVTTLDNTENTDIINFNTGTIKTGTIKLEQNKITSMINNLLISIDMKYLNMLISLNFGLTMFGYDLICVGANTYGIIDVNFLPGYKSMNNFKEYFFKHLLD